MGVKPPSRRVVRPDTATRRPAGSLPRAATEFGKVISDSTPNFVDSAGLSTKARATALQVGTQRETSMTRTSLVRFAMVAASIFALSASPGTARAQTAFDARSEADKIAFDRAGSGEKVLLISGFPQTRLSWNKMVPLLARNFETLAADLPSFGDSGVLPVPATTENAARVFHAFAQKQGAPLHVVAHDFGAWVAYTWSLLFPDDFKSLTLIDAGIPGITLTEDIELSDYFRKWNFVFQMLPDLPAELTKGKEDIYVGWWFKNKVHNKNAIPQADVASYVRAYARPGRMDAAMDYCRQILEDMRFNKEHFKEKSPIPLLAVGGQYAIPTMGPSLEPYFRDVTPVVIADSGHFVPEEQPEALAAAIVPFLKANTLSR
jgi:pimeloyl-ACP methyl ester carboxylesterase